MSLCLCVFSPLSGYTQTQTETADHIHQLLTEAEGLIRSARYDLAANRYHQILEIDKYNIAARRGMATVNRARDKIEDFIYQAARTEMLTEVDSKWELPIRRSDLGVSTLIEQPEIDLTAKTQINQKLDRIFIPHIELHEATIREAFEYLKQCAATLDVNEPDPFRKGINIVLKLPGDSAQTQSVSTISLQLTNIPLRVALEYFAAAAGLKIKVEPYAVTIVSQSEPDETLLTKEYKVPPSFINSLPSSDNTVATNDQSLITRSGAKEFLEAQGVTFPSGTGAQFIPANSKLIVKNTPSNLELVDSLVEIALSTPPAQIQIQAKFLEVTQNNLRELGLDWLIGEFAMPFGSGISGTGGTRGNQSSIPDTAYPFVNSTTGIPIGKNANHSGSITAGNRSGSSAIRLNTLDALLFGTPLGPAPGVLSLAGVFTNPQFQIILRTLSQSKGIDLLSTPSVTTKSGHRAKIELVREFIYPAEYDPPKIPQNQSSVSVNPAIPATPSRWAMEPIGVELEVEPTIGPDGFTIDLNLRPKVVEFEGFINYGSPIETIAPVLLTEPIAGTVRLTGSRPVTLTPNTINQPVFSVREVTTNVTIHDGQTIMLGGLMREDIQKTADKTPIIGDIPLLGRLFRTNTTQRIKRNLIIFVTAKLVDPAGQPLTKSEKNDEEDILPLIDE